MARCLRTLVLVREGVVGREFCSVEEYTAVFSANYYEELAVMGGVRWNPHDRTERWVRFMLQLHVIQAGALLQRTDATRSLWDKVEVELKRLELPNADRLILASVDAATGIPVRNATYRKAADISENQASRDLKVLTDAGLLVARGKNRGRYDVGGPAIVELGREYGDASVLTLPVASKLPDLG